MRSLPEKMTINTGYGQKLHLPKDKVKVILQQKLNDLHVSEAMKKRLRASREEANKMLEHYADVAAGKATMKL